MDINIKKETLDKLMPICRKHSIAPRWALMAVIDSPEFETILIEAMELQTYDKQHR